MKNFLCLCLCMFTFFFTNCNSQEEIKSISTKDLKVLLAQKTIQLIDVRTPKEIKDGAIKTAFFVNYFDEDFYEKAAKHLDMEKPVYLYCRSGARSGKAAKILQNKGFNIYNVLGGNTQWKKEN